MVEITTVSLSEAGIALIVLEQELRNAQLAERRAQRRYAEAYEQLSDAKHHIRMITTDIQQIKDSL